MPTAKNSTDLAQNEFFLVDLDKMQNASLALQTDPANAAGAVVRLDVTWDGVNYIGPISMQDPTAAIGAAYVTSLTGPNKAGLTQDRVFGAVKAKITRTDGTGGACKVITSVTFN